MKKFYSIVAAFAIALTANAQQVQNIPAANNQHRHVPSNPGVKAQIVHNNNTLTSSSFAIDFDSADSYNAASLGYNFDRFIWDMNMRYSLAAGDTSLTWAAIDLSPSLIDSYNAAGPQTVNYNTFTSYSIDSVQVIGGQQNLSGHNDTIICKLITLTAGYPTPTNSVVASDTIITNTGLSSGNSWFSPTLISFHLNYLAPNLNPLGVRIEYYGARSDTFGILNGFEDIGAATCGAGNLNYLAYPSFYNPNSYRHDMYWAQTVNGGFNQLPTNTGADIYYPCDANNTYNAGTDGWNYLDNWDIIPFVTINGLGIHESSMDGLSLDQNMPNPANNGSTIVRYSIKDAGNVSFTINDITGKELMTMNEGKQIAGDHQVEFNTSNLAAGIYMYTLNVDGKRLTKRM